MEVGKCKADNLNHAVSLIQKAKAAKADIIALPECFNSPYGTQYFGEYAEEIPTGESCKVLSKEALHNQIHLLGGSIPEKIEYPSGKQLFNTSTAWGPKGDLLAKHRKLHLFDIDIPGGITFKESETLSAGDSLNIFKVGPWNIGMGICYDLRFNEMSTLYRKKGCQLLVYPGAFNMKTGPLHWELLLRARAVDTQSYVAGIAPARDAESGYVSYGNSMLVDPWGTVLCRADAKEEIIYADLDLSVAEQVRQQIPVFYQRKTEVYDTVLKSADN